MADTAADRVLLAQLEGMAKHLAWTRSRTTDERGTAIDELRQVAGGRADLLAELMGYLNRLR